MEKPTLENPQTDEQLKDILQRLKGPREVCGICADGNCLICIDTRKADA